MQAGPAGLPAEDRPVLPSTQHMQQGEGRGSESGWRAHRVWGEFIYMWMQKEMFVFPFIKKKALFKSDHVLQEIYVQVTKLSFTKAQLTNSVCIKFYKGQIKQ